MWHDLKKLLEFKDAPEDPSSLKNRGEKSLVDVIPWRQKDAKVVFNNKKDVYKFVQAKGGKRIDILPVTARIL